MRKTEEVRQETEDGEGLGLGLGLEDIRQQVVEYTHTQTQRLGMGMSIQVLHWTSVFIDRKCNRFLGVVAMGCYACFYGLIVGVGRFTKSTVRFGSRFCGHGFRFGSVYVDC